LLMLSVAWADDLEVESTIEAVTLYQDRARVTREVTVTVDAGRTDLVFDGLPLGLIAESLAAEGEGTAGATLLGIDTRPQRGTEDRDERIRALKAERRDLEDQITDLRDVVQRVRAEMAFVTSVKPVAPSELRDDTMLADDAPEQLSRLAIRDLEKEVDRIKREIALAGGAGTDSQRVAVGLDARRAGRVTVRLMYVVTGASWSPRYNARYRPADGTVRLELSGTATQRTGEDWVGVDLLLSTARPQEGTAPPGLSPFYLREGYSPGAVGGMGRGGPMDDGRATVVDRSDLDAEVLHRVVARRLEAAWLTARVENTAEWSLLPGPVSAYLGTAYVGEGVLPLTAPGEEVDLSFGVDGRVAVKRTRLKEVAFDTKLLGNRERQQYGFKTEVANHTGRPIKVVVVDQIPTSAQDEFKVEVQTEPEVEIPKEGVFEWEAEVPSEGEATFTLEYEVSWPEGMRPMLLD
ncbi:MAG: mucoidy inhibitor MuiA family protein, partial [Deltaproteobacteria bacterium]|nr:mucoidy inhibitor MuiA family protein [Deltaproteobacteria bacterium]